MRKIGKVMQHRPDSLFSWFVCVCASLCQGLDLGFAVSYGVLLPEVMDEFGESRQKNCLGRIYCIWIDLFPRSAGVVSLSNDWMSLPCHAWMFSVWYKLFANCTCDQSSVDVFHIWLFVWFGFFVIVFILPSHNSKELL